MKLQVGDKVYVCPAPYSYRGDHPDHTLDGWRDSKAIIIAKSREDSFRVRFSDGSIGSWDADHLFLIDEFLFWVREEREKNAANRSKQRLG